jgi:flagellar basal body rod protein FlgC
MFIASNIAITGMNVAALRLQVSVDNVANAYSDSYRPLRVNQVANTDGSTGAFLSAVKPNVAFATRDGMPVRPNVSLATELFQQFLARYTSAANAQVVRTDARMTAALLDTMA